MLSLYAFFHFNLAYSSIEVSQRPEVIAKCYRSLLKLSRDLNIPLGIEASGYTLEAINSVDPSCLEELQALLSSGRAELIGSGYAQIIGPLVPADVNVANLRFGNEVYERLLGLRPTVAFVNEQAYSSGIVSHYLDAGYHALIMEWNNPAKYHPGWEREWLYFPQYASAVDGRRIPLIWNNSIFFQKFQRYAHGEMELDEYLAYIHSHSSAGNRVMPLYGNDAEIFDFRPGRYQTEAVLHEEVEWQRIGALFAALMADESLQLVTPSAVLRLLDEPSAGQMLRLESPEDPVPVKKQEKYNISRWAVTGRDDLGINTACWRIYKALRGRNNASDAQWRELCYLWSSDFRTHITEKRWLAYRERLNSFEGAIGTGSVDKHRVAAAASLDHQEKTGAGIRVERLQHLLEIETATIRLRLNCRRGLAVDALCFKEVSTASLCGTLPHGYYDDISLGADFYTGHLVLETPAQPRITDLVAVTPVIDCQEGGVLVSARVSTPLGDIEKWISVEADRVVLTMRLHWPELPVGSLRLAAVTLNPLAFDRQTLFYRTHNGGFQSETFSLEGRRVNHGESASLLVSAKQVLGMTEGTVEIGDGKHFLRLGVDQTSAALVGLVTCRPAGESYFARCVFSGGEMDETSRPRRLDEPISASLTITASREGT